MDPSLHALRVPSPTVRYASYALAAAALLLVIEIHLLPALLAGLLVFELVQTMVPLLGRRISGDRARVVVVALIGAVVVGLLILLILGGISLFHNEIGNPQRLWQEQLMPLVEKARQQLPAALVNHLPDSVDDLRVGAVELARKHAATLQVAGKGAVRVFVHIIIGLVLGAIVALSRAGPAHQRGPLAAALSVRCQRLALAFHNIVFAQIKISLINTVFTAIFLLGVLPLMGIHVPLAKTLVAVTFVFGLLPVLGNLISNTAIAIAGLSVSLGGHCRAGVPDPDPQAGILSQCTHRGHADPCPCVGAAGGHAGDGGGLWPAWRDRRADLLRLSEVRAGSGVTAVASRLQQFPDKACCAPVLHCA
jgi:predicted PurR-regulated permease PerM